MTVLVLTRDDDALGLLVVADGHRRVGLDGYFALKAFLVLGQVLLVLVVLFVLAVLLLSVIRFLSAESCPLNIVAHRRPETHVEPVVRLFQERYVVVELLQIERSVDVQITVRRDGVAQ